MYKYYYNVINNIINDNDNILLIISNEFNILEEFSYIIKKNNIKINILINDYKLYNRLIENIKGEECIKNINIHMQLEEINYKINLSIIFHLESIKKLESTLSFLNDISNSGSLVYIYCSLSNDENKNIFKNIIREKIMLYTKNKMGYVLLYKDVINSINENKNYTTHSIKIYKKNNYIIYGNNTVYEIILKKC